MLPSASLLKMPTLPGTISLHLFSTHFSGLRSNPALPDLWLIVTIPSSVYLANFRCPNYLALILCCFILSLILLLPYHICMYLISQPRLWDDGGRGSRFLFYVLGVFCSKISLWTDPFSNSEVFDYTLS